MRRFSPCPHPLMYFPQVVRNQIKSFAMNKVTLPPGRHKIIILDEADSMTGAAQQALRRESTFVSGLLYHYSLHAQANQYCFYYY